MKISGGDDDSKQKSVEATNKVSTQGAGEKSVDAIEFQLFQLMTGSHASDNSQNKSTELLKRVAKVANMRDSLMGKAEKNPLSDRLKLVITAADQWIKAKKAEASKTPQEQ
jgi:hypothetical protein